MVTVKLFGVLRLDTGVKELRGVESPHGPGGQVLAEIESFGRTLGAGLEAAQAKAARRSGAC